MVCGVYGDFWYDGIGICYGGGIRYGMVLNMARYGMVRYGMEWYNTWQGMVWYGVLR